MAGLTYPVTVLCHRAEHSKVLCFKAVTEHASAQWQTEIAC
jgi:hypothetical protein